MRTCSRTSSAPWSAGIARTPASTIRGGRGAALLPERHGTVGPRVADLVGALEAIRQFREDISDDVWHDGLRVVRDSVHRHSRLRRGETGYLAFAGQYV